MKINAKKIEKTDIDHVRDSIFHLIGMKQLFIKLNMSKSVEAIDILAKVVAFEVHDLIPNEQKGKSAEILKQVFAETAEVVE